MLCCTSIGIPGVCTNNCIIIPLVPALLHSFNFTFFRVMIFFVPHSNQLRSYQRNPYKNCCCLKCARQEKEINRFSPTLFFQLVLLFNNFCFIFSAGFTNGLNGQFERWLPHHWWTRELGPWPGSGRRSGNAAPASPTGHQMEPKTGAPTTLTAARPLGPPLSPAESKGPGQSTSRPGTVDTRRHGGDRRGTAVPVVTGRLLRMSSTSPSPTPTTFHSPPSTGPRQRPWPISEPSWPSGTQS